MPNISVRPENYHSAVERMNKRNYLSCFPFLNLYFYAALVHPSVHTISPGKPDNALDFEQLFHDQYPSLCSYANMFLNDIPASEDIVQEVFFKFWQNRKETEIRTSVKSYLFRAVRNACLNLIDHLKVREEYGRHLKIEMPGGPATVDDEPVVSELEEKIRLAIDALPPERRKIFILSRYEGLKYKEIAEKQGISVKTVENQMGKALAFLREQLIEYLPLVLLVFKGLFRDGE